MFLFRTRTEYDEFANHVGVRDSIGHAMFDYFATSYEDPSDSVHVHEVVHHQVMANRAFVVGGGDWLQEGLAEYLSEPHHRLEAVRRLLRRAPDPLERRGVCTFGELGLSAVADDLGNSPSSYLLAGASLRFIAEHPATRDRLRDAIRAVGLLPRYAGEPERLDALSAAVGIDADELERLWRAWCLSRGRDVERCEATAAAFGSW